MSPGLLDTVGWMVSLAFAVPLAIVGVEFLRGSQPLLGGAFLALAALMLLLPEYIQRRIEDRVRRSLAAVPLFGRRFRE